VPEENLKSEASKKRKRAEKTAQATETSHGSAELDKSVRSAAVKAATREPLRRFGNRLTLRQSVGRLNDLIRSQIVGEGSIVDTTGSPLEEARAPDLSQGLIEIPGEDLNIMTISASEFEQLSDKTAEILQEASLAFERIGKDQDEIEQLKTETRAMLARLRAA
jgi:hypothetical protein